MAVTIEGGWDFNQRIIKDIEPGEFVGSHNVLVCSGPKTLKNSTSVYPIGLNENFTIQQVKEIQRLTEIGSKASYFVLGRTLVRVQMATLMLTRGNILKYLYESEIEYDQDENPDTSEYLPTPNSGRIFLNLNSPLFDKPCGLLLWIKDNVGRNISLNYLEECYVAAHNFNLTAGGLVIAEGVIMETASLQPLDLKILKF